MNKDIYDGLPMFLYHDQHAKTDNGKSSLENLIMMREAQLKNAKGMLEHWKSEKQDKYAESEIYRWNNRIDCLELALQTLRKIEQEKK